MKKFCFKILPGVLLVLLLAMWGCSSKSEPVVPGGTGEFTVYLLDKPAGDWGLWYWLNDSTGVLKNDEISSKAGTWPTGATSLTGQDEKGSFIRFDIKDWGSYDRFGLLFVNRDNKNQTGDAFVPKEVLQEYKTLYFVYSNPTVYYTDYESTQGLQSAEITSNDMMLIEATVRGISDLDKALLSVEDAGGTPLTVQTAELSGSELTITLSAAGKSPYKVTYDGKTVTAQPAVSVIDAVFYYEGDDLGLTISGSQATFKAWIPVAEKVELLLFNEAGDFKTSDASHEMTSGDKGVWSYTLDNSAGYKYYQYKITRAGETIVVSDIWGKAASPDSVASQIVDISTDPSCAPDGGWETGYTNPFGTNGTDTKKYTDAIIYEMHIRDWSRAYVSDSTGKFIDLANSKDFVNHLKDLGITHVQLVPVFDYAQTNDDDSYNWGYNPYHYNVPEGRYVKGMKDGSDSVKQFRTFIKKLHDEGIAVNMDVVYNHTSGTGDWSLYDKTVPQYFYRMDSAGNYSNGSGCGNEVATNHKMVEKYVIDSLKHWMNDYHINGFRFDLMGLHETSFMKKVYEELSAIDKNVMVYGEPWTGDGNYPEKGVKKELIDDCAGSADKNWVACFNDDFRNAIKGAEFGGFQKGHVQGKFNDKEIVKGLKGSLEDDGGFTTVLGRSLNYVECHDNYTLFDKLAISYLNKTSYDGDLFTAIGTAGLEEVKKQDMLSAAFVFLAQGTPFINGGQEFLRTKKGDENSYESPDTINQINIGFKGTYSDVYNTYKGLIALRKANPTAFGENDNAEASTPRTGVTRYTTGDFLVFFNATTSDYPIPDGDKTGYKKAVDVSSGAVVESDEIPSSVSAKGFVILKK